MQSAQQQQPDKEPVGKTWLLEDLMFLGELNSTDSDRDIKKMHD